MESMGQFGAQEGGGTSGAATTTVEASFLIFDATDKEASANNDAITIFFTIFSLEFAGSLRSDSADTCVCRNYNRSTSLGLGTIPFLRCSNGDRKNV